MIRSRGHFDRVPHSRRIQDGLPDGQDRLLPVLVADLDGRGRPPGQVGRFCHDDADGLTGVRNFCVGEDGFDDVVDDAAVLAGDGCSVVESEDSRQGLFKVRKQLYKTHSSHLLHCCGN